MLQSVWPNIAHYYTLLLVSCGAIVVGATAAGAGVFAVLRRQSLLGDAISHAALPGIAMMVLWGYGNNPFMLMVGGSLAGFLGALLVALISTTTNLKKDALLGIILSVFFGFGVVLKTLVQKKSIAGQAVLGKFFFGNASTLLLSDVLAIIIVAFFLFFCMIFFWKEFVLLSFDPEFARVNGYNLVLWEIFLTLIIVGAIVIGLHTVGVLLMSALLIAPAAAARQLTISMHKMFGLAMLFGAVSGLGGTLISSMVTNLPTGPTIVVVMSCIVFITFLICPVRGIDKGGM